MAERTEGKLSPHPCIDFYDSQDDHRNPGWTGFMLIQAARDICVRLEHIAHAIEGHAEEMGRIRDV